MCLYFDFQENKCVCVFSSLGKLSIFKSSFVWQYRTFLFFRKFITTFLKWYRWYNKIRWFIPQECFYFCVSLKAISLPHSFDKYMLSCCTGARLSCPGLLHRETRWCTCVLSPCVWGVFLAPYSLGEHLFCSSMSQTLCWFFSFLSWFWWQCHFLPRR